jgi:hypothetical protein
MENSGGLSRPITWRLSQKLIQELKWQLESSNEQSYSFQASDMLSLIWKEAMLISSYKSLLHYKPFNVAYWKSWADIYN